MLGSKTGARYWGHGHCSEGGRASVSLWEVAVSDCRCIAFVFFFLFPSLISLSLSWPTRFFTLALPILCLVLLGTWGSERAAAGCGLGSAHHTYTSFLASFVWATEFTRKKKTWLYICRQLNCSHRSKSTFMIWQCNPLKTKLATRLTHQI